jgi:hypothetical protein
MISGAVILSLLVPIQIHVREPQKFNLHQGYLVNATISTARIIGLPNLAKRTGANPENNSQDVAWLVSQSLNYQKMMNRRERFIRELVKQH